MKDIMLSPVPDSQGAPHGKMQPAMETTLPEGVTRLGALSEAKSQICDGCIFFAGNRGPCSGFTESSTRQRGVVRFVAKPGIRISDKSFSDWASGLSRQQKKKANMKCFKPQGISI